jgi:uridine kinase
MGDEDVFLIEGIQVVYPEVSALLHEYDYRSIFIRPARTLEVGGILHEPNKIRLMRRLVRDYHFRASEAAFTFFAWESVRENEEKSIFPYADSCDEQLDSLMGYEVGMLRPHLETILSQLPLSSVYRPMADTILHDISTVQPLISDWLPEHALYREFVPLV